jgi:formylglycine-generating enzyme required for sulfatase activity
LDHSAEKFGWSFVFHHFPTEAVKKSIKEKVKGMEWWLPVEQAYWRKPFGPGSGIKDRQDFPVTQISLTDAAAYCKWLEKRVPTEAEWELAAGGTAKNKVYPWGKKLEKNRMNVWQGKFPGEPTPH